MVPEVNDPCDVSDDAYFLDTMSLSQSPMLVPMPVPQLLMPVIPKDQGLILFTPSAGAVNAGYLEYLHMNP